MSDILRMTRVLRADVRRVFDAWSRAEALSLWLFCRPTWKAKATNDFRVGGRYRLEMTNADGTSAVVVGEYVEIDPPHRLTFTWSSDSRVPVTNSLVTVVLKALGESTELQLTHSLDPESAPGRAHADGWAAAFEALETYLRREP